MPRVKSFVKRDELVDICISWMFCKRFQSSPTFHKLGTPTLNTCSALRIYRHRVGFTDICLPLALDGQMPLARYFMMHVGAN
jgi:hypothetical protein